MNGPPRRPGDASGPGPLSEQWMARVEDSTPVPALTIPGTHDSAAFTYAVPFIATQTMNIEKQLNAGIRFFDLRCALRDDILEMVHGPSFLGIRLARVLNTMYEWLAAHPTEGVIVQIKRDNPEERSTVHFSQAIFKILTRKPERWRTANTVPFMRELRGKIQLFRRFEGPRLMAYGIDVSRWPDNPSTPFTIFGRHGQKITVQDHYSFPQPEPLPSLVQKKSSDVLELLSRAFNDPDRHHWYINFVSAYEINFYYQISPRSVALGGWWCFRREHGMNARLRASLGDEYGERKGRLGIVALDFPEAGSEDLLTAVIRTNFESQSVPYWKWAIGWLTICLFLLACVGALCFQLMGMKHTRIR